VINFTAPKSPCPSKADVEELARLLPRPDDSAEAIRVDALGLRFADAAAYCQTAEELLK
jgi:hypothetical protein